MMPTQPLPSEYPEHELKTLPNFFEGLFTGSKTFEIRKNDRNFQVGDFLWLREYDPAKSIYTGRSIRKRITYMTNFAQQAGVVVMGLGIAPYEQAEQYGTLLVHKTAAKAARARSILGLEGQPIGFGGATYGHQYRRIIILGVPERRSSTADARREWLNILPTRIPPGGVIEDVS